MALDTIADNLSGVISVIPPELSQSLGMLITLLKTAGILFVLYILYSIVMGIINWKRLKKLGAMETRVIAIEKKLDLILKNSKKKR